MRLFIAVEPSKEIKEELAFFQSALKEQFQNSIRYPRPDSLHLTLKFLGDTAEEKVESVKECLEDTAALHQSFNITVSRGGCFPERGRVKIIWAGVNDPANSLASISASLDQGLKVYGFPVEERDFHPHITVGRIKKNSSSASLREHVDRYSFNPVSQKIEKIALIESKLTSSGAEYTCIFETTFN